MTLSTPCALWDGPTDRDGYGRVFADGRTQMAHRWIYLTTVGPIADGLELDHLCGVRSCVAVDHLEPVTHQENIRRSYERRDARTHCKHGHPFDEANTYRPPSSSRRCCRACNRAAQARRAKRNQSTNKGISA